MNIEITEKQYETIIKALTDKVDRLELDNAILKYNADDLRKKLEEAEKYTNKKPSMGFETR